MEYQNYFERVKEGSVVLSSLNTDIIPQVLNKLADEAEKQTNLILDANAKDLARMSPEDPKYDRLKLTEERIKSIANDIRKVAALPNPLGKVLTKKDLENGLELEKRTVPLGVIGIIYEARPNVTFDVFSLCFKSGNACILKGGTDADDSNRAIVSIIHSVLKSFDISEDVVQLLPPERAATAALLEAVDFVDIIIPRGSQGLINFVRDNAKVPVIETGAGIVHTYFDEFADLAKGTEIVFNAKTRRVSVCNALDCLVIHESRLKDLPEIAKKLATKDVVVYADEKAYAELKGNYPEALLNVANDSSFGTEFLSMTMAIKTVGSLIEAIDHIRKYSSKHSEAIISENAQNIETFLNRVDAAVVYANSSTAFTDGAQFGLGAEIGISTQKLHARGPMALEELCSYKWVVKGTGQVRVP
ncbi:glutamate-5-semialdehyde dehydrogenase [Chondrinema litorale]|uniref:glutamate-5-semialdehyde dehydrogenase n=1 Tax=Chondrinema litorale TaxID=2994555 RepID=UPI00254415E0|nr:glutamate-5-semialdehyde dehydrogenase [Chondrinema litorale]UZR94720.1 glutamate-5-semialdehyde dehydrogenase [Chondrinema litorale]